MRTSSAATLALVLGSSPAVAESHRLSDTVAGHPGVTYASLLRQVVPDLKPDGDTWKGTRMAHYRHLLGKGSDNGAPDAIEISDVDVQHAREAGRDRLILLSINGNAPNEWFAILAAFDPTPKTPKLLDAANIAGDQSSGFLEKPVLHLDAQNDAVLIASTHWNSNQSYALTTPVVLHGGKLVPAFTLFTLNDHACSYARDEALSFTASKGAITATIVETSEHLDEDCSPDDPKVKPGKRTFSDTWTWNPRTNAYVPKTRAIERLEKENEHRT